MIEFQILRGSPDDGAVADFAVFPEFGGCQNLSVTVEDTAATDFGSSFDDGEGADFNFVGDLGQRIDKCGGVNTHEVGRLREDGDGKTDTLRGAIASGKGDHSEAMRSRIDGIRVGSDVSAPGKLG